MIKNPKRCLGLAVLALGSMTSCIRTPFYSESARTQSIHSDPTPGKNTIEDRILEELDKSQVVMFGERHVDSKGNRFAKNSEYVSVLLPYFKERGFTEVCLEVDSHAQSAFDNYLSGKITKEEAVKRSIEAMPCVKSFESNKVVFKDYAESCIRKWYGNDPKKMEKNHQDFCREIISELNTKLEEAQAAHGCGMKVSLYDDVSHINNPDYERLFYARDEKAFNKIKPLLKKGEKLVIHCGADHLRFDYLHIFPPGKHTKKIAGYIQDSYPQYKILRIGLEQDNLESSPDTNMKAQNKFIAMASDIQLRVEERLEDLATYKQVAKN